MVYAISFIDFYSILSHPDCVGGILCGLFNSLSLTEHPCKGWKFIFLYVFAYSQKHDSESAVNMMTNFNLCIDPAGKLNIGLNPLSSNGFLDFCADLDNDIGTNN